MTTHTPSALEIERRDYRTRQSRRSILIAIASTIAFALILWVSVINTPGWEAVQRAFFNPEIGLRSLPRIWNGFLLNLTVLGISLFTVAACALTLALMRTLRGPVFFPLRAIAAGYTDIFRGLPFIIVIYLIGFGLPTILNTRIDLVLLGVIAVTVTYSAYVAEVIRAGI